MGNNLFRPGESKYRRSVHSLSIYASAFVLTGTIFMDYGKQEHLYSALQRYTFKKVDDYFHVTEEDLQNTVKTEENANLIDNPKNTVDTSKQIK
jgi:hypothetical protein